MDQERLKILQLIADGTITAEEGAALLNSLEPGDDNAPETETEPDIEVLMPDQPPLRPTWAKYWFYALGFGAIGTVLGFGYTVLAIIGSVHWTWVFLTLPALFIGLLLCLFGWLIRTSAWLHIQIKNEETNLNISIPLPLGWIVWLIRMARPFIPKLKELAVDNLLEALAINVAEGGFNIEVNEDSGEHILVYYG